MKAHRITIETAARDNARPGKVRSCWSCSCGAGVKAWTTPELANAAADAHVAAQAIATRAE